MKANWWMPFLLSFYRYRSCLVCPPLLTTGPGTGNPSFSGATADFLKWSSQASIHFVEPRTCCKCRQAGTFFGESSFGRCSCLNGIPGECPFLRTCITLNCQTLLFLHCEDKSSHGTESTAHRAIFTQNGRQPSSFSSSNKIRISAQYYCCP